MTDRGDVLLPLCGRWDLTLTARVRGGASLSGQGVVEVSRVLRARYVQIRAEVQHEAGSVESLGFIGYNPDTNRYTLSWMDSDSSEKTEREGLLNLGTVSLDFYAPASLGERTIPSRLSIPLDGAEPLHVTYVLAIPRADEPEGEIHLWLQRQSP